MKPLRNLFAYALLFGVLPVLAHAADTAGVPFVSSADIAKAIEAARAATQSGQKYANREPFLHLLLRAGPSMVSIENRPSPAPEFSLHKTQYELFYVLEGAGKMYTGGTLVDLISSDSANDFAKSGSGGAEAPLKKGDVLVIPPNMVHSITQSDGNLVLFVVHMPAVDGSAKK
jgi:mannose-6-phosphate isomerase-like protein (cupin superfamily)